jgi:hypothetical protein
VLLSYAGAQLAPHFLLNLQSVNLRLVAYANPAVADAAVDRIRESGDPAALPRLQQKVIDALSQRGHVEANLLDALTVVGGAKGWQDLLESERLGVAGRDARTWRSIINNVREMTNPPYAASRGGVKSPHFGDGDIARLSDALALELAERLNVAADSEAALTLSR